MGKIIGTRVFWLNLERPVYKDHDVRKLLREQRKRRHGKEKVEELPRGAPQVMVCYVAVEGGHPDEWAAYLGAYIPDMAIDAALNLVPAYQWTAKWGDKVHKPIAELLFPQIAENHKLYRE